MSSSDERAEQFRIMVKPCSQELRHGQHYVSICYAGQKSSGDKISPTVSIDFSTGKTKAGFAGKSDTSYLATVAASVLYKAHFFWIAAVKHFLYGVIVIGTVKFWMGLLKRIPVVVENLF